MYSNSGRRLTKAELTIRTLKAKGHISEVTGSAEHGRYRVSDAIYRLRGRDSDLVPPGMEIITVEKVDSNGNTYGEWQLVRKAKGRA
jgi:hypothetical protein